MSRFSFLFVIGLMTDSHAMHPPNYRNAFRFLTVVGVAISIALFAFNTTSAQVPTSGLVIDDISITETGEAAEGIVYQAQVAVRNSSESDFSGVQRLDYVIDDGESRLAYIVTDLPKDETVSFTFSFVLVPGDHTVTVVMGEEEASRTVSVAGADIALEITGHRFKRGRTVEFDVEVVNLGDLAAEGLTLSSTWQDSTGEISGEQSYEGELPDLAIGSSTSLSMLIQVQPGSYDFSFVADTSTVEGEFDNNSTDLLLDVEFVDLRVGVLSTESLGWDGEGNAFMAVIVEVENVGVDDTNTFDIEIDCNGERSSECSSSTQSEQILAGEKSTSELRVWLPIGEAATRIFAVENEATFRWGDSNAINETITVPIEPELVWTLARVSEPSVVSYWSDGSANVELDLTLVNNGTDEAATVTTRCVDGDAVIEGCGGQVAVNLELDVYPTVVRQTVRLPRGETDLSFDYGAEEPKSLVANVPGRIIGVERDVWDCFRDTSNLDPETGEHAAGSDNGIGCAGWISEDVTKWPVDEAIKLWSHGDSHYLEILDDVLEDIGPFLNLEFEHVATIEEAQLKVHTGVAREDADLTGLDCIDFGGCAQTSVDDDGRITASTIAIWLNDLENERWRSHSIRATTLHELLHALTNIQHRHHDRTSVMSYDALNYTMIEGMDRGLFELLAHPLVQPGMSFDDVRELIVFSDELNDPPETEELSAHALLRRAHAALMDAGAMSFEVRGGWPGCTGVPTFGWAEYELGNLLPYFALWYHFHDGNDRYYFVGNPLDYWSGSEWWLRRGRQWSDVGVERVSDAMTFRSELSSVLQMLSEINVFANASDYSVVYRTDKRVEIEVSLDEPNPSWSRGLEREVRIVLDAKSFLVLEYEMTWDFNPRDRNSCDSYEVKARSPEYGIEFNFPDAILERSALLSAEDEADDEVIEESAAR